MKEEDSFHLDNNDSRSPIPRRVVLVAEKDILEDAFEDAFEEEAADVDIDEDDSLLIELFSLI